MSLTTANHAPLSSDQCMLVLVLKSLNPRTSSLSHWKFFGSLAHSCLHLYLLSQQSPPYPRKPPVASLYLLSSLDSISSAKSSRDSILKPDHQDPVLQLLPFLPHMQHLLDALIRGEYLPIVIYSNT